MGIDGAAMALLDGLCHQRIDAGLAQRLGDQAHFFPAAMGMHDMRLHQHAPHEAEVGAEAQSQGERRVKRDLRHVEEQPRRGQWPDGRAEVAPGRIARLAGEYGAVAALDHQHRDQRVEHAARRHDHQRAQQLVVERDQHEARDQQGGIRHGDAPCAEAVADPAADRAGRDLDQPAQRQQHRRRHHRRDGSDRILHQEGQRQQEDAVAGEAHHEAPDFEAVRYRQLEALLRRRFRRQARQDDRRAERDQRHRAEDQEDRARAEFEDDPGAADQRHCLHETDRGAAGADPFAGIGAVADGIGQGGEIERGVGDAPQDARKDLRRWILDQAVNGRRDGRAQRGGDHQR
ncbi:hypothetical protein OSTOST_13955, partial [Ostertagia ostertagi]